MRLLIPLLTLILSISSCAQSPTPTLIGGTCEGCEAVLEYGNKKLTSFDVLPGYPDQGEPLEVSGTIFQTDGITPAAGVIMYIYHTNANGIYPTNGSETNWGKRHGYMRGWIKTDKDGKYTFYTIRPASYPNTNVVQHIHATILEPDGSYYYIQDFLFLDDPNLNASHQTASPRGGAGNIMNVSKQDRIWVGWRNIVLRKGL